MRPVKVKVKADTLRNVGDAIEGLLNAVGEQQRLLTDLLHDREDPETVRLHLDDLTDTTDKYLLLGQELVHEIRRRVP